jgi:hypothetical protein
MVAVILMLSGTGLVGVFAGLVDAYFVEEDDAATDLETARLHGRLNVIEDVLGIVR